MARADNAALPRPAAVVGAVIVLVGVFCGTMASTTKGVSGAAKP